MFKRLARVVGLILAVPYLLGYCLLRFVVGPQRALTSISESVAKRSGLLGVYIRHAVYGRLLSRVGSDVYIGFMTLFSKQQAAIGDRVYIGRFCTIGYAELGDDVMLADGVQILSGRHQHGSGSDAGQPLRDNEQQFTKVTIGKGAWFGAGAVVMADVGQNAIVGAGAVVVKPVPDGAKVGGVPARPIQ